LARERAEIMDLTVRNLRHRENAATGPLALGLAPLGRWHEPGTGERSATPVTRRCGGERETALRPGGFRESLSDLLKH